MSHIFYLTIWFMLIQVLFATGSIYAQTANKKPEKLKIQEGYLQTDDGTKLYYRKVGSGKQIVIIPGDLFLFDDFKQFAGGRTLIFYDMRGRGRSEVIPDEQKSKLISIYHDVKDVETVRKYFKIEKFILIGYSYLGLMSVMYAMDYPERVERIIQLGPVPLKFGTKYPENLTNSDKLEDIGANSEEVSTVRKLRDEGYNKTNPKEYCEKVWQVSRYRLVGNPANVERLGKSQCDMPNEYPVNLEKHFEYSFVSVQKLDIPKEKVAQLKIPVLTIHGTKDRNAVYGSGREWAVILSNARLLTVEGAAHQSWADAPKIVFPAIELFLKGKWTEKAEKVTSIELVK